MIMKRILLAACIPASACINSLGDWGGGPLEGVNVCVQGDAGRCCSAFSEPCRPQFDEGCEPNGHFMRPAERCLSCLPWEIDDGGMPERDPSAPPPSPPPDARIFWVDDAGVSHDAHLEVCGPATYTEI